MSKEKPQPGRVESRLVIIRVTLIAMLWGGLMWGTSLSGIEVGWGLLPIALLLGSYAIVSILTTMLSLLLADHFSGYFEDVLTIKKKPWPGHSGSFVNMVTIALMVMVYWILVRWTAPSMPPDADHFDRDAFALIGMIPFAAIGYILVKVLFSFVVLPLLSSSDKKEADDGETK